MVTDFHPEGRSFFFCGDCPLTQHEVPDEMPGSPERLRVWAEVLTGQRRDDQGIVYDLTPAEAAERQRLLRELDSGGEGT